MHLLNHIYGIIFRPKQSFQELVNNYSSSYLYQSAIIYVVVNLIGQGFSFTELFRSLFNWFFFASLIFLTAYIFVLQRKDYGKILTIMALANVPLIFLAPADIFYKSNQVLGLCFYFLIGLWILNLKIIGLSTILNMNKRKIFLLYLLLPLALIGLAFSALLELI